MDSEILNMINFDKLWQHVINDPDLRKSHIHGPDHWARVERNGIYIGEQLGADLTVVKLFALFHDSRRQNDAIDKGHGQRGADYAKSLRNKLFELADEQFDCFYNACRLHTRKIHTKDVTMGVCWDSDRLDLGRIGMVPSSEFLNTEIAKNIADLTEWDRLEKIPIRKT